MKKNILILFITIFTLLIVIGANIGNENRFLNKYKKFFPEKLKITLKETIFVFQNQKTLKNIIEVERNEKSKIKKQALLLSFNQLFFKKEKSDASSIKIFKSGVADVLSRRGYLQTDGKKIYFVTGSGKIFQGEYLNNDETIILSDVNSNFLNFASLDYFMEEQSIVNHFLIDENNLYLSFTKKINDKCYNNSIIVAELNSNFLNFKNLFNSKQCLANFFNYSSGGRMDNFDKDHLILTIGDYDPYSDNEPFSQYDDDLRGKILKINKTNGTYKILSKGHRNSQGLFYDKLNSIIFSTDHGPRGGDEINIQQINNNKIENYGWPISSYGFHYNTETLNQIIIFQSDKAKKNKLLMEEKYKRQPLYKSHIDKGYSEPIIVWNDPNLAPTQIISIFDDIKKEFHLYVASLGNLGKLHKSLHHLKFDRDFNLILSESLKLGQRIRDIIFIEKTKSFILYLEESSSLAFIKLNDDFNLN
jgi:hypothetical protein